MSEAAEPAAPTRRPPWKNPWLIAFLVGAAILTALPFVQRMSLKAPPPLARLGAWQLTDHAGNPFGSEQLQGQVWIASFFFTRCPSVCPAQQESLKLILPHVEGRPIKLVSITVDPEHDHPEVLAAYARKMGAPPDRWTFLTGSKAALKDLLIKRFFVEMGDRRAIDGTADLYDISHVKKFALVDQNGDLRGFWDTDEVGRGNVINAALMFAEHGPAIGR